MDRRRFLKAVSLSAAPLVAHPEGKLFASSSLPAKVRPSPILNRSVAIGIQTTGRDPLEGHRIVEIAAVELIDRRITGSAFHSYLNPGHDSDPDSLLMHDLTRDILSDKPQFSDIADELARYIDDDALIVHDARVQCAFLTRELAMAGMEFPAEPFPNVIDTRELAKQLRTWPPSLSTLCTLYKIAPVDRGGQVAFQDALAVAQVYLALKSAIVKRGS